MKIKNYIPFLLLAFVFNYGCSDDESSNETVTDIDGNTYKTATIGTQTWMAENLKVTKYPNGDVIPLITDNSVWADLESTDSDDAYCYSNNDALNGADTYGALYTYAAAKNVCPTDWHLPSDAEWTELTNYLIANGYNWDGSVTDDKTGKSLASTSGWANSNSQGNVGNDQNSNNKTEFSALPGGYHYNVNGLFEDTGYFGYWWSSTTKDNTQAYMRYLKNESPNIDSNYRGKSNGMSVRCLKD